MSNGGITSEQLTDFYARLAPVYDLWAWLTETKARHRCLELAAIRDGEEVLEVAVGTGLAFERILAANPSGRNEGVDLSRAMLARAQKKAARSGLANFHLRVGDARSLDFPDDSFDVVVNNYMVDLLPQDQFTGVLKEFHRVLRPGGRLALVNMRKSFRWYQGLWDRINPALLGGCRGVSLVPLLEDAGFRLMAREFVSQLTFPSEVVCAMAT